MNDDFFLNLFGFLVIEILEKYRIIVVFRWGVFSWKGKFKLV